jgi:hypothetical protein
VLLLPLRSLTAAPAAVPVAVAAKTCCGSAAISRAGRLRLLRCRPAFLPKLQCNAIADACAAAIPACVPACNAALRVRRRLSPALPCSFAFVSLSM